MCGIAGFSSPAGATINARHLAHNLLKEIENRGSHASGFSFANTDGTFGIYKRDKPGSQLPLHELPRNADTVILHTRYATQGSPKINQNNHPVVSTDNKIALVHNGVISNDWRLRDELGLEQKHGTVDSLVIPSLIAQQGMRSLSKLSGYAAIAWVDVRQPGMLNIAKLKTSPVAYTWLYDGTLVFASTKPLLTAALRAAGYEYGGVFELGDSRFMQVAGGFIMEHEEAPRMTYDYGSYQRHSNATSGGHGTPATPTVTNPSRETPKVTTDPKEATEHASCTVGGQDASGNQDDSVGSGGNVQAYYEDLDRWRADKAKRDENDQKIAMRAMGRGSENETPMAMDKDHEDFWDKHTEDTIAQMETVFQQMRGESEGVEIVNDGFYIMDNDGAIEHYPTLDDLEGKLRWLGKMTRTDADLWGDVPEEINWINHIVDLGSVDGDELISWVDDSSDIDNHESPAVRHLSYVRDGVYKLATLKGA